MVITFITKILKSVLNKHIHMTYSCLYFSHRGETEFSVVVWLRPTIFHWHTDRNPKGLGRHHSLYLGEVSRECEVPAKFWCL